MYNKTRRQIVARIKTILARDNLIKNEVLCSYITEANTLPVSVIAADPQLYQMNAYESLINRIVAEIGYECEETEEDGLYVKLPYRVDPTQLVLRLPSATISDLRSFVTMITGASPSRLTRNGDFMTIKFKNSGECIGFWRTLACLPYKGELVEAFVYSEAPKRPTIRATGNEFDLGNGQRLTIARNINRVKLDLQMNLPVAIPVC